MEAGAHTWGARPSEFLTVRDKVRSPLYDTFKCYLSVLLLG